MRRKTTVVKIGNIVLSSDEPVMIQSMLNTPTMDTAACVEQSIRIIEAGGQLVRITAPGVKEAQNLKQIHQALKERGYTTPISADIHFTPDAALIAARYVEKVRINPGNFVDKRATFKEVNYTDEEYVAELKALRKKFVEFLDVCREYGTAVRIGTNHGSLSDRIMSRFGDTPAGMVESTMEYLRICKTTGFNNVVISLKSSDCRVMVDAVRLLVREMKREGMRYPLHLGVTEAGEGEDGRIRSAVGIGTLLNEGIGDTIRVSLTEAPEAEIPVAKALVNICSKPAFERSGDVLKGNSSKPLIVGDLSALGSIGEPVMRDLDFSVVKASNSPSGTRLLAGMKTPEVIYTEIVGAELTKLPDRTIVVVPLSILDKAYEYNQNICPLCSVEEYLERSDAFTGKTVFLQIEAEDELDEVLANRLSNEGKTVLVLSLGIEYHAYREVFRKMEEYSLNNQAIIQIRMKGQDREKINLTIASQVGGLFLDRLAGGLWITAPEIHEVNYALELSRNILQSAGVRRYKAEFISCPGCGRTLFDLQSAVAKVKKAFGHLSSLKIAVMGCIVNGPGEMGDADYGYVGAGNGKVNLYKGRQMMRTAVPEEDAIEALRELINENEF